MKRQGAIVTMKVHGHAVTCERDNGAQIWVGKVEGVPGFIVSGPTCTHVVEKVRTHLPAFLQPAEAA